MTWMRGKRPRHAAYTVTEAGIALLDEIDCAVRCSMSDRWQLIWHLTRRPVRHRLSVISTLTDTHVQRDALPEVVPDPGVA
jgi:hypothetical protein